MDKHRWSLRLGRIAIGLTVLAGAIAFVGLTLARYDAIPKLAGFGALMGGGLFAFFALLCGLAGRILGRGQSLGGSRGLALAMICSLLFTSYLASRPLAARGAPAIHDVTTSIDNPPQFRTIRLRTDNLAGVGSLAEWRKVHAAAYPDLVPLKLNRPLASVIADARRIADANGWEIAVYDPAAGRLEATASVSYIRFRDDVVVIVTPTPDGRGSVVIMRSVSRVGVGDLGVNAKRIKTFLATLATS